MISSGDIHDLAAAYALDVLDDSERAAFEAHLASCETCSAEIESLKDTASALAYAAAGPAPPPALRERVLEAVRDEPASNVVPLRRGIVLPAVATVAVAAGCAAIVLGIWAGSLSDSLDAKRAALRVVADPAASRVALGRAGEVVVTPNGDAALVSNLSAAPKGKTYEIWVIQEGAAPQPAGLFAKGRSGAPIMLARKVPKGAQVGLSLERAGGARKPTVILSVSPTI